MVTFVHFCNGGHFGSNSTAVLVPNLTTNCDLHSFTKSVFNAPGLVVLFLDVKSSCSGLSTLLSFFLVDRLFHVFEIGTRNDMLDISGITHTSTVHTTYHDLTGAVLNTLLPLISSLSSLP